MGLAAQLYRPALGGVGERKCLPGHGTEVEMSEGPAAAGRAAVRYDATTQERHGRVT